MVSTRWQIKNQKQWKKFTKTSRQFNFKICWQMCYVSTLLELCLTWTHATSVTQRPVNYTCREQWYTVHTTQRKCYKQTILLHNCCHCQPYSCSSGSNQTTTRPQSPSPYMIHVIWSWQINQLMTCWRLRQQQQHRRNEMNLHKSTTQSLGYIVNSSARKIKFSGLVII